jgi:D-xylose transport system ATP-binding protein
MRPDTVAADSPVRRGQSHEAPRLELRAVAKSFGAVRALDGVDLEVYPGEVIGLVGDNGAGKSTLVKVISGNANPYEGEVRFEGQTVQLRSPKAAAELGIATVYQDLALCDNLDVVGNLFLGRAETRWSGPLRSLDEESMERRTLDVLKSLGVRTVRNVRAPVASLSGGQRQSIAVARAVMWNSKVMLLDEPTAALGVEQSHQVLELVKRLRSQGHSVVLISHNLADVFEVADRIVVLRLGRVAGNFPTAGTSAEQVIAAITGAEFERTG